MIEQAVERGQNHALVQAMMGGFAYDTGHLELALPFIRRAALLDPLGASPMVNFGDYLVAAGRLEEAESAIKQAAELNHQFADKAHAELAWIRICQGDVRGAAEFASLLPPGIARDQAKAMLGHLQGDQEAADKALSQLLARSSDDVAPRLAFVYAVRGENDEAFHWLAIAGDNIIHSQLGRALRGKLVDLQHAPLLKPLHMDPRWEVWLKETSQQLLIGLDHEVVPILQSHLERHPELYSPAGQGWARPESESDLERAPPE
jgi:tetratricopeptide (TPR) repeat protein